MRKRVTILTLILLQAFTSPWLLAQDTDATEDAAEQTAPQSEQGSQSADNEEAPDTGDTAPDENPEDEPEAEDDDFVPSAQISEDLSVSFPVDI